MRLRRGLVAGTALALVAGGGYAAWASATEASASYRTAVVTRGDVQQQLELTGTLSAEGTDELSFASSGTVASVPARPGTEVRAGQLLATLDRTSLRATAERARADLAAARAQLEDDEELQDEQAGDDSDESDASDAADAAAHSGSGDDQTFVSSEPTAGPSQGTTPGVDLTVLHQQQDAVTSAQSTASQALAAARDALAHQTEVCAHAFQDDPGDAPTDNPTDNPTDEPTDEPTAKATPDPADQACTDALAAVQDAQQKVADAQQALQDAIGALTRTLEAAVVQLGQQASQPSQQPTQQPSQQPTQKPTQQPTAPQDSAQDAPAVTVTAATLAHDQADIENAKADLVDANEALAGAVLRAPHSGTIAEVDVAPGDAATAGTTALVVVSPGLTTLDVTVSDTQLRALELGQKATVTPAGSTKGYPATVSYLDPVPDTSSGSATYAVTLTLDREGLSLPSGGSASAAVVVGTAKNALTVPTSAVSSGFVQVLDGSQVTRTRVTTGIVGTTRTEITDGLEAGDVVVVADLSADLPTSDNQGNRLPGDKGFGGFGGNGPVVVGPGGKVPVGP